ncbi:MAG TPA: hypothetical protein PLD27_03655 [bacterium]|nr:hypothetical protein [bacterium]HOL47859.1 hypothetical protein [bacterium]HPQ17898.1 hypothetical protein [bacterium]
MKIKIFLFLFFILFFFVNCDFVLPPTQSLRESNEYLKLLSNDFLIQEIKGIKENFSGIILLISGSCKKFSFQLSDEINFTNILEQIEINNFSGNIRKTTYIKFNKNFSNYDKIYFRIIITDGSLYFGYKKDFNDLNLIYNNSKINGALYFKSVYSISVFDLLFVFIKKIFKNIIFFLVLIFLTGLIIYKKNYLKFLLPDDLKENKQIVNFLVISIILRFIIMPFFCHIDFLSGIWVPFQLAYTSIFYYATDPSASFHLLNQLVHFPIMVLTKFIMPELYHLWKTIPYDYNFSGWYNFCSLKNVFFFLFILKIPFLIFDYLCLFVFLKLTEITLIKKKIFYLWLFNPVSIYVIYFIGRYEVYTLFFLLLGLLKFKEEKIKASFLFIGIAIMLRQYPILFLPFLLFIHSKNIKEFLSYLIISLFPLVLFNLLYYLSTHLTNISAYFPTGVLANDEHSAMLFKYKINDFILFPFFYFLFFLFIIENRKKISFDYLPLVIFLFFNIMYGTSNFEPQYFMWIIPFLVFVFAFDYIKFYEVLIYFILYFCFVFQWDKSFNFQLAMPIFPDLFFNLPSVERIILQFLPVNIINNIFVSFLVAINFWFLFKGIKQIKSNNKM